MNDVDEDEAHLQALGTRIFVLRSQLAAKDSLLSQQSTQLLHLSNELSNSLMRETHLKALLDEAHAKLRDYEHNHHAPQALEAPAIHRDNNVLTRQVEEERGEGVVVLENTQELGQPQEEVTNVAEEKLNILEGSSTDIDLTPPPPPPPSSSSHADNQSNPCPQDPASHHNLPSASCLRRPQDLALHPHPPSALLPLHSLALTPAPLSLVAPSAVKSTPEVLPSPPGRKKLPDSFRQKPPVSSAQPLAAKASEMDKTMKWGEGHSHQRIAESSLASLGTWKGRGGGGGDGKERAKEGGGGGGGGGAPNSLQNKHRPVANKFVNQIIVEEDDLTLVDPFDLGTSTVTIKKDAKRGRPASSFEAEFGPPLPSPDPLQNNPNHLSRAVKNGDREGGAKDIGEAKNGATIASALIGTKNDKSKQGGKGEGREEENSADAKRLKLAAASAALVPSFKYVEVVRGKGEREALNGVSCRECELFYGAVLSWQGRGEGGGGGGGGGGLPPPLLPSCGHRPNLPPSNTSSMGKGHQDQKNRMEPNRSRSNTAQAPPPPSSSYNQQQGSFNNGYGGAGGGWESLGRDGGRQEASRHRTKFEAMPSTPPGFWDMGFPDDPPSGGAPHAPIAQGGMSSRQGGGGLDF